MISPLLPDQPETPKFGNRSGQGTGWKLKAKVKVKREGICSDGARGLGFGLGSRFEMALGVLLMLMLRYKGVPGSLNVTERDSRDSFPIPDSRHPRIMIQ